MSNLLSKSLLIAGVCVTAQVAAPTASAHTSGTWVPAIYTSCLTVCKNAGLQAAMAGHYPGTTAPYTVCRLRTTHATLPRRPGFNLQHTGFSYYCRVQGASSTQYDCLCIFLTEPITP